MKYKVGDRVKIKSLDWYNENKDEHGDVICGNVAFFKRMQRFCGRTVTIIDVDEVQNIYTTVLKKDYFSIENHTATVMQLNDDVIEGLVEEKSANYSKVIDNGVSNPIIAKTSSATIDTDKGFYSYSSDGNLEMEWNLPQGYQFVDENGNVINATKIVLEKKKKEYPTFKNLGECKELLGEKDMYQGVSGYKGTLLTNFQRLLIFRDAYWKIAGEEMGLGKPWEPDYDYSSPPKYTISCYLGDIVKEKYCGQYNRLLPFPTEEMRDAFKENFDPDIEICKELL